MYGQYRGFEGWGLGYGCRFLYILLGKAAFIWRFFFFFTIENNKLFSNCNLLVTHTQNLCSTFNSEHTHTHREHTPGEVGSHLCCGPRGAVGGSVSCSRAPQSWYWRWRERCTFTAPPYNSSQTWDSNLQPLDYESDSLTIRPWLPIYISSKHSNNKQYLNKYVLSEH